MKPVNKKKVIKKKSSTTSTNPHPINSIYKINQLRESLQINLKQVEYGINPELHVPQNSSLSFLKKNILRVLKVYTAIQIHFNNHVFKSITLLQNLFQEMLSLTLKNDRDLEDIKKEWHHDRKAILSSYLEDIDSTLNDKFIKLRKSLQTNKAPEKTSLYFDQFADDYYLFQQEKFRGSFEMIKERQLKYIPQIQSVQHLSRKYPFAEIGFGRGEFMEILREQNIEKIIGADTSPQYVEKAKQKGYEAVCMDGVEFLESYKGKLSGVSAFHLIEHIPFPVLFDLVYLAHMKLVEGGVVIFETPNPENVLVSSHSFYIDHTHITKLPPTFVTALFEFFKFKKIEILYNLPIKEERNTDTERVLFGPQDYAIVAYK